MSESKVRPTSPHSHLHRQLLGHIASWDRRFRLALTPLWLPRGLIGGVVFGLTIAVISRMRPWLFPQQIAIMTGLAILIGAIMALVGVWIWPRSPLHAAQQFDRTFGLKERSSTALEILTGTVSAPPVLVERQLADALAVAGKTKASRHLPLQW